MKLDKRSFVWPVRCSAWFAAVQGTCPTVRGTWGWPGSPLSPILSVAFGADARKVSGAASPRAPPAGSTGLGSVFSPPVVDHRLPRWTRPRWIPFGRLTPLPTPPPNAPRPTPLGCRSTRSAHHAGPSPWCAPSSPAPPDSTLTTNRPSCARRRLLFLSPW